MYRCYFYTHHNLSSASSVSLEGTYSMAFFLLWYTHRRWYEILHLSREGTFINFFIFFILLGVRNKRFQPPGCHLEKSTLVLRMLWCPIILVQVHVLRIRNLLLQTKKMRYMYYKYKAQVLKWHNCTILSNWFMAVCSNVIKGLAGMVQKRSLNWCLRKSTERDCKLGVALMCKIRHGLT